MIHDLSKTNSIFNTFLAELRDVTIQKDSMRFRRNLERVGEILGYEISKKLDYTESQVVTAYRKHTTAEEFDVHVEYMASPDISNKTLIISDPMLATGSSMLLVYKALLKQGRPSKVIIASAIASPDAIEFLKKHLPDTTEYWVGAIDMELTAQSYIVPGMGDAGDLAYGVKC